MPITEVGLPFSGNALEARHASYTGARAAEVRRAGKTKAYLALLASHGALSDQAVAALTNWPLSSVNSIRNGVGELIRPYGFDEAHVGSRITRRTRWRLRTTEEQGI